jgi:hypothetical protein
LRHFAIDPTPSVARRLVRLAELVPGTFIDPAISELAQQGIVTEEQREGLSRQSAELLQDLLDYDLRAIVSVSQKVTRSSTLVGVWLEPIIRAARILGVEELVFSSEIDAALAAKLYAKRAGMRYHSLDSGYRAILPEDSDIPRSALLIARSQLTGSAQVVPFAMEFPRCIILSDALSANSIKLHPNMPTLLDTFNRESFPERNTRDIAFLFNTTVAISRVER